MQKKKKNHKNDRKKAMVAGSLILGMAVLAATRVYQKETGSNNRLISDLQEVEQCYLCGNSNRSLVGYYRNFDTIGLISLNDWYVWDFKLGNYEEGEENDASGCRTVGNMGEISFTSQSMPLKRMAGITVTLPEDVKADKRFLQKNLCQTCLDKITASIKEGEVPLCLVDFQTLEVYSLQKQQRDYQIRDYQIEVEFEEKKIPSGKQSLSLLCKKRTSE